MGLRQPDVEKGVVKNIELRGVCVLVLVLTVILNHCTESIYILLAACVTNATLRVRAVNYGLDLWGKIKWAKYVELG